MRTFPLAALSVLFPMLASALPVGSFYAPVTCQNGLVTVFEGNGVNLMAVKNSNTSGIPIDLEQCALTTSPDGLDCKSSSLFLHASKSGGSYIIPAGAHDPLPVQCQFFPPTP